MRALLGSDPRPAIYLNPGQLERSARPAGTERVFDGPPPADVLARALDLIVLAGDCEPAPDDLTRVRDRLRSGSAGRVRLHRAGSSTRPGPVITGLTLRALRRVERWQPDAAGTDLIEALFGSVDLMA